MVNVLRYEALGAVVLVGHSYGGMVIAGVAERVPERIRQLVFLDAFVPRDGESVETIVGPETADAVIAASTAHGDGWRVPFPGEPVDRERVTPMMLAPLRQPLEVREPVAARLPRSFVHFTAKPASDPQGPVIARMAARVRAEGGWTYREVAFEHSPQLPVPQEVARLLLDWA